MAEENETELAEEQPKRRKKLFIALGAVLVVVIIAGVSLFLFSDDSQPETPTDVADPADISRAATTGDSGGREEGTALYVGMPRPFVFNVPGEERDRLVQIKVQLMVRGVDNEERAKRHIPLIEGTLLQAFSSMTAEELQSAAGKDKIRDLALEQVREVLQEVAGQPVVEQVLFTGFVLQ